MKKRLVLSLFFGFMIFQGCSSNDGTPTPTPGCAVNTDCSGATPVCNAISKKCVAETATACLPNGTAFCSAIAPGMACNSAGTACACGTSVACVAGEQCVGAPLKCTAWPRLAFLTFHQYALGAVYSSTSNTINSASDATKACNAEYKANAGTTYTAFPNKKFIVVMGTNGQSMYENTYPFATNPRVINDLKSFRNNTPANTPLTAPTAGPLPTSAASTCTNTPVGFDCIGNGSFPKFQVGSIDNGEEVSFWTGAPNPVAPDVSGFFTAGTDSSTCSSWTSKAHTTVTGIAASSFLTWGSGSDFCDSSNQKLLCLESD